MNTLACIVKSKGMDTIKKNTVYYIVYNNSTLQIIQIFGYFGRDIAELVKNREFIWLNTSHPATKEILLKINLINNTNY